MKNVASSLFTNVVRRAAAAGFVILLAAFGAAAQGPPSGASGPSPAGPRGDSSVRARREANLRQAEFPATVKQMTQQQLAAAIEQTRNDFKRIQLVRNDIVDVLVSKKPLDYKQLSGQAEEVNRRALRLKSFLMKPTPEGVEADAEKAAAPAPPVYDDAAMRAALVKLCNTVHSFTGNPMFKNPDVIDAQQPAKAGGGLLAIIELSDHVRRNAERLSKSSK